VWYGRTYRMYMGLPVISGVRHVDTSHGGNTCIGVIYDEKNVSRDDGSHVELTPARGVGMVDTRVQQNVTNLTRDEGIKGKYFPTYLPNMFLPGLWKRNIK